MIRKKQQSGGYSIVEVLVAVLVLVVSVAGPLTIAYKGLQSATLARQQNIAFFLAQEGIEAIMKKRNDGVLAYEAGSAPNTWSWTSEISANDCSANNACGVDLTGSATGDQWGLFECSDPPNSNWSCDLYFGTYQSGPVYTHYETSSPTGFNRKIYLDSDGSDPYVHVVSEVTWQDAGGTDHQVRLETYLYDIYGTS